MELIENDSGDWIVILSYFLLIFIGLLVFVIYFYLQRRKEVEVLVIERINEQKAIESLVLNIKNQLNFVFNLRYFISTNYFFIQLSSIILILVLIAAIVDVGISFNEGYIKIGAIFYFISINLYLILRQYLYYKDVQEKQINNLRFQALYQTNYKTFDNTMGNYLQIIVLLLEFFQLLSFPIQDLELNIDQKSAQDTSSFLGVATLLPNISSKFYLVQFWTITSLVLLALSITVIYYILDHFSKRSYDLFWVSYFVPIVNMLYLPILVAYINSVACFFENDEARGLLKCSSKIVQPKIYIWFSLAGFSIAYILFTIFLTSYERKPIEGDIEFKSKGVSFIKNMSLLLSLQFSLIPIEFNRIKGIISSIILVSLICYNIKTKPCYVNKINYWRSMGFCCILWTALPSALLPSTKLVPLAFMLFLILGGWICIFMFFVIGRLCFTHTASVINLPDYEAPKNQ